MKVAYKHLINSIPSKPSIDNISNRLFQLGHEHEIHNEIFDIELTPNRGDCLSVNGLLRDLAVFFDISLSKEIYVNDISPLNIGFTNKVPETCPHISFLKIDIEGDVRPYKGLLRDYFDDLNINKNNFFTDISNYISYEMGQPTHCYDSEKIKNTFSLDLVKGKHEFKTLMGKKIELNDENYVFLGDDGKIINLAGIMGGMDTSCSKNTKSAIIECAYFNPEAIIGKSIKYDIDSEAAHKFERGVDPLCHGKVLRRFIKIVEDHASIKSLELFQKDYFEYNLKGIPLNEKRLSKILGITLDKLRLKEYLTKLNFDIKDNIIFPPSYRGDIKTENDIAEEIARIIGYNNIEAQSFKIPKLKKVDKDFNFFHQTIKSLLIDHGFFEVINNPFVSSKTEHSIKIDNPLDSNRGYLRTSMRKSLLENLLYNERRQQDSIKLFEFSEMYYFNNGIKNKKILGIICSGRSGRNYMDFSKKIDINYLKNIFESLHKNININPISLSRDGLNTKLTNEIIYAEIEIDAYEDYQFEKIASTSKKLSCDNFIKYQPISNYPASSRDLSFSIKDIDGYNKLQDLILNYENNLIKEVYIFDFFINEKNNEIKLGFRFIFQSKTSTITENEVNNLMSTIIESCLSIDSVSIPGLGL